MSNPTTPEALQPRAHQVAALTDLTRALAVHDRTQLVMACGTGKTLVGRWHAQASDATRILVLLPSLGLVAQTLREWRRANKGSSWRFRALVVCSDPTTAAGEAERAQDGVHLEHDTWNEVGAQVTTSPAQAARFLQRDHGQAQVVFSTYHSSPVIAAAQHQAPEAFDLVICDEAHRLAGQPSEAFTTVLDPRKIVARKRVFMTATPRVYAGENGTSMDDPRVFGPVAHTVSFGEAIQAGLLTDYQVAVIAHRASEEPHASIDTVAATVLQAVDQHQLRRVLTFHGGVAKSAAFAAGMHGRVTAGGVELAARHVSGQMRTSDRAATLTWLAEPDSHQARIVSNARCLSEGIDVPSVDGVVFADQRSSVVDIIQAIGRVLRPAPGKKIGTIVLPVAVDADGDQDTQLSLSDFAQVWNVLRALRAHDQRLDEELVALQREQIRGEHSAGWNWRKKRVTFDLPADLVLPDLELRLVKETGSIWERNYALLERWAEDNGGRLIPRAQKLEHDGGLVYLGEWVEQQRIARRRGVLPESRARRLEQIPGWAWDKSAARWQATVKILQAYAAEHGTVAEHPTGSSRFAGMKDAETPRRDLGVWMAAQRQAYRLGTLTEDQVAALEALPGWDWDAGLPAVDVAMVEALRVFVEFEKHADVPEQHLEDGLRLGSWCWAVRRRRWTGTLAPALFDEIRAATPSKFREGHFDWAKSETQWRLGYFALRQYAQREGTATPTGRVREQLPDTTVGLGQWAALQRMNYRRGELDERHAKLLEALPGWAWEIELQTVEAEEPVELRPGQRHGTAGAYGRPNSCRCAECLEWRRSSDRARLAAARDRIEDPVPAHDARKHLEALEAAGVKRGVVVSVSGVPLGAIRKVFKGTLKMERAHRDQLLAVTLEQCQARENLEGTRGRTRSAGSERIDSAATWALLDDLAARGFTIHWVSRELGYTGGLQIQRDRRILRRVHEAIEDLHGRVGDLVMPKLPRNVRRPSLDELTATTSTRESAA